MPEKGGSFSPAQFQALTNTLPHHPHSKHGRAYAFLLVRRRKIYSLGNTMTAISLKLPDELARKSTKAAEKMGISRAELIRVALEHELADIGKRLERADMVKAVEAMREDPDYQRESTSLDQGLMEDLPNEPENWWQG